MCSLLSPIIIRYSYSTLKIGDCQCLTNGILHGKLPSLEKQLGEIAMIGKFFTLTFYFALFFIASDFLGYGDDFIGGLFAVIFFKIGRNIIES